MDKKYTKEIKKLAKGLIKRGIAFTFRPICDGCQIIVTDKNNNPSWDAVCHEFSYGGEFGLLELMGRTLVHNDDDVEGYLTAEDILKRLD